MSWNLFPSYHCSAPVHASTRQQTALPNNKELLLYSIKFSNPIEQFPYRLEKKKKGKHFFLTFKGAGDLLFRGTEQSGTVSSFQHAALGYQPSEDHFSLKDTFGKPHSFRTCKEPELPPGLTSKECLVPAQLHLQPFSSPRCCCVPCPV